jgi:hypothetical protein
MVEKKFEINIGGDELVNYDLTILSSEDKIDDFFMALIKFTSEWKNTQKTSTSTTAKPCGCEDAK